MLGGISNLGVQAQTDCATYVPTGDPVADQRCAAINFMSAHCLTPTSGQNKILGASAASQSSLANCKGSYGAGQSQFDYGNTVKPDDAIFDAIKNAATNANGAAKACTEQTVVTQPAKYSTNQCVKSTVTDAPVCNQTLKLDVTNSREDAVKNGTGCPAVPNGWVITRGPYMDSGVCVVETPYVIEYGMSGGPVGGWYCGLVGGCLAFLTDTYTCPNGGELSGTVCYKRSVSSSWVNSCSDLEKSAGNQLGAPE